MTFCDFAVRYNPELDTQEDLVKRIFYSVFIKRIHERKPAVIYIGGDSGEGKSYAGLRFQEILLELQGEDLAPHVDEVNVFVPFEYPEKLKALLFNPELKGVNVICMHEAREVVKAKQWQSFMTQAISDVNALSRSVKRMIIIIISQFIRDITSDIRYTLNYYVIVRRPKRMPARIYINVMWKDDRDLEKPKLRRRKLSGYLIYPNGKYRRFVPQYFEFRRPVKEIRDKFEALDMKAKSDIIKRKIEELVKRMKEDAGVANDKIAEMVDFYSRDPEQLHLVGRIRKGEWVLRKDFREMHSMTKEESRLFESHMKAKISGMEAFQPVPIEAADPPRIRGSQEPGGPLSEGAEENNEEDDIDG